MLPAKLVNLTSGVASLKTMAGVRKEEYARIFTELESIARVQSVKSSNAIEGIVTSASPARDKLELFRNLFTGRKDVYAHGYRRKDGGIGYTPACANEWKPGICPKATYQRYPRSGQIKEQRRKQSNENNYI